MADTLSMLRVVQLPPMEPLEISPVAPPPAATCVLVPLHAASLTSMSTSSSPVTLHTLAPKLSTAPMNNNNNSVNNNNITDSIDKNQRKLTTKVYARIEPATPEMTRCKRKISFQQAQPTLTSSGRNKAASVARRNERERNRVKQVNQGFERLRQHVPNGQVNKKMSKVETLRSALEYIHHLQDILESDDPSAAIGLNKCPPSVDSSVISDTEYPSANDSENPGQSHIGRENLSPGSSEEGSLPSPTSSYQSNLVEDARCAGDAQSPLNPDDEDFLDFATSWLMQTQS